MREDEDCGVSISCLEDSYLIAEREYDKYNEIIAKLEQQLSEKDKEIERLKADLKSQKLATDVFSAIAASHHEFQKYDKILRKQICDKILELCDEKFRSINEFDFVEVISRDEVIEILDKIEEGIKE